jgi:hypothetical protein
LKPANWEIQNLSIASLEESYFDKMQNFNHRSPVWQENPQRSPYPPSRQNQIHPRSYYEQLPLYFEPNFEHERREKHKSLMELCLEREWKEVIVRCNSAPHEADPAFHSHAATSSKRAKFGHTAIRSSVPPSNDETVLAVACRNNASLEVVKALYDASPQQFTQSNTHPLHVAIKFRASADVLKHLITIACHAQHNMISKEPSSPSPTENWNHEECLGRKRKWEPNTKPTEGASSSATPAILAKDADGITTLHLLIDLISVSGNDDAVQALDHLLTEYPSICDATGDGNPLARLVGARAPNVSVISAAAIIVSCAPDLVQCPSLSTRSNPLHLALSSSESCLELVKVLLKGSRGAVAVKNLRGELPLHTALAAGVSTKVLELILQATTSFSENLILEVDGRTLSPIHLAWVRHVDPPFGPHSSRLRNAHILGEMLDETVNQIIDQLSDNVCPQARNELLSSVFGAFWERASLIMRYGPEGDANQSGKESEWSMLHAAVALNCPKALVSLSLAMHQEDVKLVQESGKLPLHIAATSPHFSQDQKKYVFDRLLTIYPEAASVRDQYGMLPLHYAIESEKSHGGPAWSDAILGLVQIHGEGLEIQHPSTRLFPFMQAAERKSNTSTVFELLVRAPHLIQQTARSKTFRRSGQQ